MVTTTKSRFLWYGWMGLGIIAAAEVSLLLGVGFVGTFFTPICWWGYILFADALVNKLKGKSLLSTRPGEFVLLTVLSIAIWLVFEGYNAFMGTWKYINLPDSIPLRYLGYGLSFATICPGLFETAEILEGLGLAKRRLPNLKFGRKFLAFLFALGVPAAALPIIYPSGYLIPLVWLAFIFMLEPVNYVRGAPSILKDLQRGHAGRLYGLLIAGFICGFLWEFWNYWAVAKWNYYVPYLPKAKIFEMPILGYFGFPPFALECYAIYHFVRSVLTRKESYYGSA
ncbi:MAG: hypothetical protein AMS15_05485 [Planctomycetes bacterium DG_23]|nr:MAG: hypothetical protein AMS15_05485 [Planctomycetes bacterium DG_23]